MKKITFFIFVISAFIFTSCKKTPADVSKVVKVSYPTIIYSGGQFFSIPVGGTVPSVTVSAYDSTLGQSLNVVQSGTVDNTTPGLYILQAIAKNSNGYTTTGAIYVAVTNISPTVDLSGNYARLSTPDSSIVITKEANGLYQSSDIGGALSLPIVAYFAQINDSTIVGPDQPTDAGTLSISNGAVTYSPDTTLSYHVVNASFGTQLRTFVKY
ncbi:MAG: hypothetical protein JSS96_00890 [Bacteroidetes bacterium]|nr:hypothetical protein [Bacteroidota bacterium]